MQNGAGLRGPYFLRRQLGPQCAELLRLSTALDADVRELAAYISEHPILADAILHQANSPLHATGRRVRTIDHAVALLGINRIRQFAVRFAVADGAEQSAGLQHHRAAEE